METPEAGKPKARWYYHPLFVIVMLFFFAGPFGLPLLWKSPQFNKPAKIVLTILMFIYSWYLAVATLELLKILQQQIQEMGIAQPS